MKVFVVHISTGHIITHENVARIIENSDRFELIYFRQRRGPITSTSYHKSLFDFSLTPPKPAPAPTADSGGDQGAAPQDALASTDTTGEIQTAADGQVLFLLA